MKSLLLDRLATLFVLGIALSGCSDSPPAPDLPFLSSDAHFWVGGHHIVIPVVALRGPGHVFDLARRKPEKTLKDRIKEEARNPSNPMNLDKLDLIVREYGYTSEPIPPIALCQMLKRQWSKTVCRGEHQGLLKRLPEKFDLVARDRIDIFKSHGTVGKERVYDQIADKTLAPEIVETGCDKASRFCTAVVEVMPGLLAVWTVWDNERTGITSKEMADTQGAAIVQFVRRAIGPVEDQTLVEPR